MILILLGVFFKVMIFCDTIYSVNCGGYDMEEESTNFLGVNFNTALAMFRQTPEYVKILKDKIEEVKINRADMLSQIKYHYFNLMATAVKEYMGYDEEEEYFSSINERDSLNPLSENTGTSSIHVLDEYSKKKQRVPVKDKNMYKDVGLEYARRAVHTFRKNMGDKSLGERPQKNVFEEDDENKKSTIADMHKDGIVIGEKSSIEKKLNPQPNETMTTPSRTTTKQPTTTTTTTTKKPTTTTTTTTKQPTTTTTTTTKIPATTTSTTRKKPTTTEKRSWWKFWRKQPQYG